MFKDIDFLIVNYNSGEYLVSCVQSLLGCTSSNIYVFDNASVDGSLDGLEGLSNVIIISSNKNLGFGSAVNRLLELSNSNYICLVNPDTVVNSSWQLALTVLKESDSNVILGARQTDISGEYLASFGNFLKWYSPLLRIIPFGAASLQTNVKTRPNNSREVDYVSGGGFMTRRSTFELLKGFDEDFFLYYEDMDLGFRAARLDVKSIYFDDWNLFHKVGVSSSSSSERTKYCQLIDSRKLFMRKHYGRYEYTLFLLAESMVALIAGRFWKFRAIFR